MTAPRMHARNPETGRGTACGRYGVPSVDLNDWRDIMTAPVEIRPADLTLTTRPDRARPRVP
jgi:hypothetical protein